MRLRRFITIYVLALPALCAAESVSQGVPQCDISKLPLKALEATTDTLGVDFGPYATAMVAVIRRTGTLASHRPRCRHARRGAVS